MNLPFHQRVVEDGAAIIDGHVAANLCTAGVWINLHFGHVHATGKRTRERHLGVCVQRVAGCVAMLMDQRR